LISIREVTILFELKDILKEDSMNLSQTRLSFSNKATTPNFANLLIKKQSTQHLMRNIFMIFALSVLTGCVTDLRVSRHNDTTLTNAQADVIFGSMGQVIRDSNTPADFACAPDYGTIDGVSYDPSKNCQRY